MMKLHQDGIKILSRSQQRNNRNTDREKEKAIQVAELASMYRLNVLIEGSAHVLVETSHNPDTK